MCPKTLRTWRVNRIVKGSWHRIDVTINNYGSGEKYLVIRSLAIVDLRTCTSIGKVESISARASIGSLNRVGRQAIAAFEDMDGLIFLVHSGIHVAS